MTTLIIGGILSATIVFAGSPSTAASPVYSFANNELSVTEPVPSASTANLPLVLMSLLVTVAFPLTM